MGARPAQDRRPAARRRPAAAVLAESQRWRLLSAAAATLAERGYADTTAYLIARRAGVSSTTFYHHFADLDACLLAAFQTFADSLLDVLAGGCRAPLDRSASIAGPLDAALRFLAAEPSFSCLLGPELPAAVPAVADARAALLDRLASLLARAQPPPPAGRGSAARRRFALEGALALASARLRAGEPERLPALGPELAALLAP